MQSLKHVWPSGARIAVMLTVMYEAWPERKGPPYGPMASSLGEGTLDLQSISWTQYGGRMGIWRLLRIFESFGVQATVCANAKALERFPGSARDRGWRARGRRALVHAGRVPAVPQAGRGDPADRDLDRAGAAWGRWNDRRR